MTDTKELSPIAKKTDDLIKKWVKKLGLELWTITCDYCDSHRFIEIEDSKNALAFCHVNWPYLTATIRFNKDHLNDEPEENIELIVIHELMHIIINEMRDDEPGNIDHEERVATILSKAFLRVES